MIVKELKLSRFRNLKDLRMSFSAAKNLIYGCNGAGKTSVLEAIFLLAFGKSFLGVNKADIAHEGGDEFFLHMSLADASGHSHTVAAHYKNQLSLFLDDKKSSIFEISAHLHPLIFSSSGYSQTIESKTLSRKLLDRFVFGVNSLYINYLLSYNKCLKQKTHLLKNRAASDELSSWNKAMSEASEKIIEIKMDFVDKLNGEILTKFALPLRVDYSPSFRRGISCFLQLEQKKNAEILSKRCLLGPHLDVIRIFLRDKDLKFFSSGEKKIHLLMVYIAFINLYMKIRGQYPVFLVDDFDTAIDARNIDFLIENYPDLQVIATSVNSYRGFDRLIGLAKEN